MKVIKHENEFGLIISFKELDKQFDVSFSGNGDLYWTIRSENVNDDNNFIITKENYEVYRLFEELFDDIENIKIDDDEEYITFYLKTEEEKQEYIKKQKDEIEYEKENNTITWYSDETSHEVANILKIKKEKESFVLEFYIQPYIEGYDRDFNSLYHIPIRFRNSGSSYDPFNIVFMRMYEKMKQVDNVNDYGHQIHIEEYLYNQNNIKKLTK